MKVDYFVTKNGILKRKQNTVYFVRKDEEGKLEKRILPIEKIYAIYAYGRLSFSSGVVSYLSKYGVPIHFFNKYGWYEGTFYPRKSLVSGEIIVRQAEHYLDNKKRLFLAKEFIKGCGDNLIKNLQYYIRTGKNLNKNIETINSFLSSLEEIEVPEKILGIEGNMWNSYYNCFSEIFPKKFKFEERSRRPPKNMLNCLISFGNSLLYSAILTEMYNTQLEPSISFLHKPFERRFSLCLDISEVFRPLLVDRTIFKLVNKKIIKQEHFLKEMNSCLLNESGKRLFLEHWHEKLKTTIKHRKLKRNVSYQKLIRLECYKLVKHFVGLEPYKAFRIWW